LTPTKQLFYMKKVFLLIFLLVTVALCGFVTYVKIALPNVGPAPEIRLDKTKEQIERGKYLANSVCACVDCHSSRDWKKFAGPIIPGTMGMGGEAFTQEFGFPGKFYARNITPFGLSSWTDGEIYRAITSGVSKDGHAFFPVMPYLNYGKMAEEDIKAIIAYLRSLKSIESTIPESVPDFPMNIILNTIPKKANPTPVPSKTDILKYGEYITNAASCIECHTKQEKGEKLKGMEFAGGFEFKLPNGKVVSPNITPHETGIKDWTKTAFVNRFKAYADSSYQPHEVENGMQTVMPWMMYANMTEEDLGAIYDYLRTVAPVNNTVTRYSPN
jgi:mono/diheme cytochrome c family protein